MKFDNLHIKLLTTILV